jgi:toxin CptA
MHSAPPVDYPVGRSSLGGAFIATLWIAGGAASAAWFAASAGGPRNWTVPGTALLAGLVALRWWLASPQGQLRWDGAGWRLDGRQAGTSGFLAVGIDLQGLMLVGLGDGRARQWVWVEANCHRAGWSDFRRAVYSRPSTGPAAGEGAGAAPP